MYTLLFKNILHRVVVLLTYIAIILLGKVTVILRNIVYIYKKHKRKTCAVMCTIRVVSFM